MGAVKAEGVILLLRLVGDCFCPFFTKQTLRGGPLSTHICAAAVLSPLGVNEHFLLVNPDFTWIQRHVLVSS